MNSSEEKNSQPECEFDQNLATLRELELFHKLPMELLRALALHCRQERYRAGEDVFSQGDFEDRAYVVLEGTGQLVRKHNGEEREMADVEARDLLCSLSLMGKTERLFTLRATSDIRMLVIPGEKILTDMAKSEDFCKAFLQTVVSNVVSWEKGLLTRLAQGEHDEGDVGVSLI